MCYTTMSFITRLCNLMISCFSLANISVDSSEDVDQESPGFHCSGESEELPGSVIREILSKLPVESVVTYKGVCKSWYQVVNELCAEKSRGDQSSNTSIIELPDSVIQKILSKIPIESVSTYRGVCKSWDRLGDELSNKSDGDQNSIHSDSSFGSGLPDLVVRDILLKLPTKNIGGFCKAWNQFGKELSDVKEDGDKKTECLESSSLSELHTSVIHEILLKLPFTSIMQCRCVCKSWYQVISHPYFAKVYFNNPTLTFIAFSQHMSFIRCPDDETFGFVEIGRKGDVSYEPMNAKSLTSRVMGITKANKSWTTLVGSCNGLLCLVETPYEDDYYVDDLLMYRLCDPNQTVRIFNPLIGEYMELPKVHGVGNSCVVYGFGSSVDGGHYKVVRIAMECVGHVVDAQILTIGVDEKWRDIDISTLPMFFYSHAVTLNGVLHWLGFGRCGDGLRHAIYAFDIVTERGQCFPFPFIAVTLRTYLSVLDEHLCIIANIHERQVDLWTMKRYGVVDSWKRDIIVMNSLPPYLYELIPVTTTGNGELFLFRRFDKSLMTFDPRTKKCVDLEVTELNGSRFYVFSFTGYTPSFVSPHGLISRQISSNRSM